MKTRPEVTKSFVIIIPESESNEKGCNLSVDFGLYFRPIFIIYYYGCFLPFKIIVVEGEAYSITTNLLQKVVCVLIQTLVSAITFGEIYAMISGPVPSNLETTLRFLDRVNKFICCCLFFYAGWFKKKSVIGIFGKPSAKKLERNTKYWIIFLTGILFLFSIFAFRTSYAWVFNSENGFQDYTNKLFLSRFNIPAMAYEEIPIGLYILSFVSLFGRFYKWILIDLITWLMDFVVFVTLILGRNFKRILVKSSENSYNDEEKVFRHYYEIAETINRFNEFMAPIFLSNFIALIFYWAVSTVDTLDAKTLPVTFSWAVYILSSGLRLIFAAEAHYQISYLKTWIMSPERRSVLTTAKYLEIENSNVALKGGRFFSITYNFLGAASSVILTYAIMMIQFRGNK